MSTPPRVIEQELVQQGIPIGAEGGADKKREQLVNEVFAMQRKGVVALPAGATMKLLAMPATSVQMLKDQWEACNDAFAILWSGNNLTTSIKGGSLAASDNAQTMFGFVRRFDAAGESTFVHDDVLGDWAEINFGARDSAPWPERDVEPPEDLARKSQTWFALSQAVEKLEKNGWLLDKTDTAEVFSLPLIKGQPNTEKPAPPATPGQTPAAPQVPNAA